MTKAVAPDATAAVGTEDWPLRPWLFAIGVAIAALLFHLIVDFDRTQPWRAAAGGFVWFAAIAAALTLERRNWREPLIFAGGLGLVMAGLAWRAAGFSNHWGDEQYGFAAGTIAALLAVPLFQAQFHRRRFATPYVDTHFNVWSDVISVGGALAFVLLSFLTAWLLSELFMLLKIGFLQDLMRREWFEWLFAGAAFGAALGTLRGELKVLGTLQRVVMLVLAILAVPLAVALIVFLTATLTSGPAVLWSATRSATPVLLACAAGSFVLVNAILRDGDADMTRSRVQRIAALVLALGIAPLTLFAAVSMGTRVAQHGLSPERLWGLAAIAVAVAYGLGYFVAALRGRRAWPDAIRAANLRLAVGTLAFALLLALPIFDFGAIAARDQVSRLVSGRVNADHFDFEALRWDFGDAGRRALTRLAGSGNAAVAGAARQALAKKARYPSEEQNPQFTGSIAVSPRGAVAPPKLIQALEDDPNEGCSGTSICRIFVQPDGITAIVLDDGCARPGLSRADAVRPNANCQIGVRIYRLVTKNWRPAAMEPEPKMSEQEERASLERERAAIDRGDVKIAPAPLLQVQVGGRPSGPMFSVPKSDRPRVEGAAPRR